MALRSRLRPALLGPIVAGGTVGTAVRNFIESTFEAGADGFPWATLAINVSGAFLLGALLELLVLLGPDRGWRRTARLGLGTGLLGGYTTYSTFVVETVQLGGQGRLVAALAYDVASLVAGFLAALAAALLFGSLVRRRLDQPGGRP